MFGSFIGTCATREIFENHNKKFMKLITLLMGAMIIATRAETRDTPDRFGPKEESHTLRITARILTEDGKPLENADVHVAIENFNDFKDNSNDIRGKTDKDGKFSAEGVGRPQATIIASHVGYYWSRKDYGDWENIEETRKTGKYIPWDPVIELTLKKIGKPIPMIVRLKSSAHKKTTPTPGTEVGYDLFEDDWIAPHGKGKTPDLLMTLALQTGDEKNNKVTGEIKFENPDDGLIPIMELVHPESHLKYPPLAGENGYDLKVVHLVGPVVSTRDNAAVKEPVGYMFRIRTQKDKATGKIISANYGKIIAATGRTENVNPFVLSYSRKNNKRIIVPGIQFSCYLNPTPNDRNIEYDQHNNLAPEADKGSVYEP